MRRIFFCTIIAGLLLNRVGFGQVSYTITDLGSGQANAINASGQVVGQNGNNDILFYSNGVVQDLGNGDGLGINDAGQIVGYDNLSGSNYSAFLDTNGSFQTIGGNQYEAIGINDSGVVVGDVNHGSQVWIYSNGSFQNIVTGSAYAINNGGQVTGANADGNAFLYSNGSITDLTPFVQGHGSSGTDINNSGEVVGTYGAGIAFSYSNGSLQNLGSGSAYGINDSGQIVGTSGGNACIFSGGSTENLNTLVSPTSGWSLQRATAINDLGQIVGYGTNSAGQLHGFLLTPINVPIATQAPSAASFPTASAVYTPTLTNFVQNNSGQFSTASQQFLISQATPQAIQQNSSWKQSAIVVGDTLEATSQVVDVILAGQSVGDAVDYLALSVLPPKYATFASALDSASSLAIAVANGADPVADLIGLNSYIYGDLVAPQLVSLGQDPYDPNYQQPVVISGFPVVGISGTGNSFVASLSREFTDETHAALYLQAANTAANRYSSALENSDSIDATLQLESLLYYLGLYRSAMSATTSDFNAVNSLLPTSEISDLTYDPTSLTDLQAQIEEGGLPTSTLDLLISLGLSQTDINQDVQNILALDPNSFSGDLYGQLDSGATALNIPEPGALTIISCATFCVGFRRIRKPGFPGWHWTPHIMNCRSTAQI